MTGCSAAEHAVTIHDIPGAVLQHAFAFLEPRDLCAAAAVSRGWRRLVNSDCNQWRALFKRKWHSAPYAYGNQHWKSLYGRKMQNAASLVGRHKADYLAGHKAAIRAVKLFPTQGLVFTGSVDRTLRAWDLASGLPLAVSPLHGGSVRCIHYDGRRLVSGSTDEVVRLWDISHVSPALRGAAGGGHPPLQFSFPTPVKLRGHSGPVSCLDMDERHLFSGSWDCTVRQWDVRGRACVRELHLPDWLSAVVLRQQRLFALSGLDVVMFDLESGRPLRRWTDLHEGSTAVTACEVVHDGSQLITGGADGRVLMHDIRSRRAGRTLGMLQGAVSSLRLEYPWIACASERGPPTLFNVSAASPRIGAPRGRGRGHGHGAAGGGVQKVVLPGGGGGVCVDVVDVCDQWLAVGCSDGRTVLFDFGGSVAAARGRKATGRGRRTHADSPRSAALGLGGMGAMDGVSSLVSTSADGAGAALERARTAFAAALAAVADGEAGERGARCPAAFPLAEHFSAGLAPQPVMRATARVDEGAASRRFGADAVRLVGVGETAEREPREAGKWLVMKVGQQAVAAASDAAGSAAKLDGSLSCDPSARHL